MKKDSPALQVAPPWGPIGYIVYKRTYARRLNENQADSPTEEFADTIHRVIESCNSQLGCGFDEQEQEETAAVTFALCSWPVLTMKTVKAAAAGPVSVAGFTGSCG
jgi:hypothetical protein